MVTNFNKLLYLLVHPPLEPAMRRLPTLALLLSASLLSVQAVAGPLEDQRARNAVRVLGDVQNMPEQAIPDKLLDEGRAIIVIPDTIKAGLVLGGRRGHGLMSVKTPEGSWSNPVFIKLTGASIGFQAGVQSSDVILVFRNDRSLDDIVNGKVTLGADAGVAAGPVGRNAAAATDGQLKAEIWSWSRARGLFAGVALDGAVLQIDDAANLEAYGPNTTPRMILEGRVSAPPSTDVIAFRDRLEESSYSARENRGTAGAPAPVSTAPRAAPVSVTAPTGADTATTAPLIAAPEQPAPQQGFQPVGEGEVRVESLDGGN
jgi:lipid-binding SYLF domain-containing protein